MVPVIETAIEDDGPLFSDVEEGSGRNVSPEAPKVVPPQPKPRVNTEQIKPAARQQIAQHISTVPVKYEI